MKVDKRSYEVIAIQNDFVHVSWDEGEGNVRCVRLRDDGLHTDCTYIDVDHAKKLCAALNELLAHIEGATK